MSKWLRIYTIYDCCELILNKDLIESFSVQNGGSWADIIIGQFIYSIAIANGVGKEYSVTTDRDLIPDDIYKVSLIRIRDLVHDSDIVSFDYDERDDE